MKRHGIPDYDRKFSILWHRQFGRCAITGEKLTGHHKIDLHHILPNTKPNRKLYPHYIDSLWNLQLVENGAHLTKPHAKHPPYAEIAHAESVLAQRPESQWNITPGEAFTGGVVI